MACRSWATVKPLVDEAITTTTFVCPGTSMLSTVLTADRWNLTSPPCHDALF
jgi:hypothetical protein